MFRKPYFWIAFILISAAVAVFSWRNFSKAFPLVSIDIRMDRRAALQSAAALAAAHSWRPDGFRQAASFSVDQEVQNFVELEGGGKDALRAMVRDGTFAPYTWLVRHFKEGDPHETNIRFTPSGEPYGFVTKFPEQEPGATIEPDAAREIAERAAATDWHVDFSKYPLAESSVEVRPAGRTDHTFVYERQDIRIGEGRFRLRLVVSGNSLSELTYFVQVPEAFTRRYAEMRSSNTAISAVASVGVIVYILGFAGVGLFFMMRQRWLIWRPAAFCGTVIAGIVALGELNSWPLVWMSYDTAIPASGFALQQLAVIVGTFLVNALVFSVSFMAAETLSRRAFPNHIQFWNIWSGPIAGSKQVLGRTAAGYLGASIAVGYIIVFYSVTQRLFGWWVPSDTLVNPDVFAAYIPSFSAIALSAQAGFWEECLFRAVPLATFALIGERLGRRKSFLVAGMIVQALVFGSGHAGYANQPAYARVVELIVPSMIFGGYFLAFGLLPGIVMHYTFDAVMMSLPVFAASTPRAHFEQALVVLFVLIPLWVVLISRSRRGKWTEVPEDQRNRSWTPPPAPEAASRTSARETAGAVHPLAKKILPVAALAGLLAWLLLSDFRGDAPRISISRADAEAAARHELQARHIPLDSSWTALSRIISQPDDADRFVWQTAGKDRYAAFLGTSLPAPHWFVRFARFEGDVAARAEEYQMAISGEGQVYRFRHLLPESAPGAGLTSDEARNLAQSTATQYFHLPADRIKEVTADADKRPARTDWTVEFKETGDYGLGQGEPRLAVTIAGDSVVDANRYIHVPEEWQRAERRKRNIPDILSVTMGVITLGVVVAAAVAGAIRWSRGCGFSRKTFLAIAGLILLLTIGNAANNWPGVSSQFLTTQPFAMQAALAIVFTGIAGVLAAIAFGLAAGIAGHEYHRSRHWRGDLASGLMLGVALAGVRTAAGAWMPSLGPAWPDVAGAGAVLPLAATAIGPLGSFVNQAILLSLIFFAIDRLSRGFQIRKPNTIALMIALGLITAASPAIETVTSWLIAGIVIGICLLAAYLLFLRQRPALVVPMAAAGAVLSSLRAGLHLAYPADLAGSLLAGALILAATVLFLRSGTVPPSDTVQP